MKSSPFSSSPSSFVANTRAGAEKAPAPAPASSLAAATTAAVATASTAGGPADGDGGGDELEAVQHQQKKKQQQLRMLTQLEGYLTPSRVVAPPSPTAPGGGTRDSAGSLAGPECENNGAFAGENEKDVLTVPQAAVVVAAGGAGVKELAKVGAFWRLFGGFAAVRASWVLGVSVVAVVAAVPLCLARRSALVFVFVLLYVELCCVLVGLPVCLVFYVYA